MLSRAQTSSLLQEAENPKLSLSALPLLSQNRSTLSIPAALSKSAAKVTPYETKIEIQKYPLYEHTSNSQKDLFPSEFYDRDNINFQQHKMFEQRIFENRQKIVNLQKVLGPYRDYIRSDASKLNLPATGRNDLSTLLPERKIPRIEGDFKINLGLPLK